MILWFSSDPESMAYENQPKKASSGANFISKTSPADSSSEESVVTSHINREPFFKNWTDVIALLALVLAVINLWHTFFLKGKPIFACTKWTAVQMHLKDQPCAAFAVQISLYNKGKVPLQLFDFVLQATSDDNQTVVYEAILLWDLRQWIEDGNRPDRVGRAQKGQVPLPLVVSPGQLYDFNYPILFLPIDKSTLINPKTADSVSLSLYTRTDRSKGYKVIGTQKISSEELKAVIKNAFSSVISSESTSKRKSLLKEIGLG